MCFKIFLNCVLKTLQLFQLTEKCLLSDSIDLSIS